MFTYVRDIADYVGASLNCKRGATAIEYGLIAAGIAVVIIVMVNTVGQTLLAKFTAINTNLH